jgi:tetratricopeptide (TPR) repeat protein
MSVNTHTSGLLNGVCHHIQHFIHQGNTFYLSLFFRINFPKKNGLHTSLRCLVPKLLSVFLLTGFTVLFENASAQTPTLDSLKKVLPLLENKARIDCLNELGFEYSNPYWGISKYIQTDTAMLYTKQALHESLKLNYAYGIGKAYQNIGMVEEEHGNYIRSEYYTTLAMPILYSQNMETEFHRARINYAWCKFNTGKYNEAIEIYIKELLYYKKIKDQIHIAMINRMIGKAYDKQGYSELAFNYYEADLKSKKNLNDILGTLNSPFNKGDLYFSVGDTMNAILNYREAAFYAKRQHLKPGNFYSTLSWIYRLQKKFDSALFYLNQIDTLTKSKKEDLLVRKFAFMTNSLKFSSLYLEMKDYDRTIFFGRQYLSEFSKGGDVNSLMIGLKNVSTAYLKKANESRSFYFAKQLLYCAQKANARPFIRDAYLLLSEIYDGKKELDVAYNWFKKYSELNSILEKDNFKAKMYAWDVAAKMDIEEEAYRTQNRIHEARNKEKIEILTSEKKSQLYIFISAIFIGLLVTLIIFRNIILKRKKVQLQHLFTESQLLNEKQKQKNEVMQLHQQKTDLEMQALRAQMNPHFIFNSLNSINMFILENNKLQASEYLSKFSRLIRLILQNSQAAFIPLERELEALKLYLELESLRFDHRFEYKVIVDDEVDTDMLNVPPLIIQPYAENAIWHGLMQKDEKGRLIIELYIKDEMLIYVIADNGIGRKKAASLKSKSAATHKSMGMRITTDRLLILQRQNEKENSVLITDLILADGSPGGTEVRIQIPLRYD